MSKTKVKEYKVYMTYETGSYGGAVCPGQENKAWPDFEDEHNTFTPKGLMLKAPDWSETIDVTFDPKECDHLYLVIIRYSSGSTFGQSFGHWHVEGAYKGYKEAEKIEKMIKDGKYKGKNGYNPWEGYFERLEGVTVERMNIWK